MNKLAIFVEGQTEQVFAEKLLSEVAGEKNVRIEKRKVTGGASCKRKLKLIEAVKPDSGEKYYVLIVDCANDELVKSRILEEYDNLARAGYELIIGLRDVHPIARADIAKLRAGLPLYVKTKPIHVQFVLAVMEIEAWFLAEHTHFERIDTRLTVALIKSSLGFDPSCDDMELRDQPASDLDAVYRLVGRRYSKRRSVVQRTVDVLDFARLYLELPSRYAPLRQLATCLEGFLG
jgi:hypothetical protein